MFLWRTLCLPEGNEYRTLMLNSIEICLSHMANGIQNRHVGPVAYILQSVFEYGFTEALQNCIRNNNFGHPNTWKRIVKNAVWENENIKWKASCILYGSLKEYASSMSCIKIHPWWYLTKDRPHLVKFVSSVMALLLGSQPRGFQRNFDHIMCKICDSRYIDSPKHVLFECSNLHELREKLLKDTMQSMPNRMARDFKDLDIDEATNFVLYAFNCTTYVQEWADIMANLSRFVYYMYRKRAELLDPG